MTKLTPRQKNWLEGTGAHIGTASKNGVPKVIVVDKAIVENDSTVKFILSEKQKELIVANINENPRASLGPGGIGSIRAAYQFKGVASLKGNELFVNVDEIYSTKPGPEAGLRLDNLPYEDIIRFETSRWADDGPPR
ncbi:MAG: hypothetical protein L3J11_05010 [Draconibacterium sp.]|nr:hypothetical protein [Draconibacterium sp.]